ncbi:hypothetical protein pah_c197o073 [Parachlamydia acanthamoebae str. Hall's coccus]|jgi:3-phosphoshikimate 1-carboxyvinyltransferase|nr:hypothetical protein pah_c197o073 [Parachlamydia acanthamoebae str. Hall's coccus]
MLGLISLTEENGCKGFRWSNKMGKYLIKPATLTGEIGIPPSKSHTLRAILFATLAKGKSVVHHYLASPDTYAMIEACRHLGAKIEVFPTCIEIRGTGGKIAYAENVIDAGNSGIVLRFCTAIGALGSLPIVITGDHSIRHQRPMQPLLEGLSQLGVSQSSMRGDGFAPVIIQGPIKSGKTVINGEDSQPVSALLIAAAFAEGSIEIVVKNPGETPWINLTLNWLDRLGIPYENHNFTHYRLFGNACYEGFDYTVPGDFSSAAFPIAAALVTDSELVVRNIDMHDVQGDKELLSVFQRMGAKLHFDETQNILLVKRGGKLSGISVDINNFIDSITILSVLACFADGETHIRNAAIARRKECNRITSIATELRKMGADVSELEDGLIVRKSILNGAQLHSYQDHRMVMSLTVAALGARGETLLTSTECVSKTFPTFVRDFNRLGANIQECT